MKKEIVLKLGLNKYSSWRGSGFGSNTVDLCRLSVHRVLGFPKHIKRIIVVFSDKAFDEDSNFTITSPSGSLYWWGPQSKLREFKGYFSINTKRTLGAAYKRGYRFLQVEYEDD